MLYVDHNLLQVDERNVEPTSFSATGTIMAAANIDSKRQTAKPGNSCGVSPTASERLLGRRASYNEQRAHCACSGDSWLQVRICGAGSCQQVALVAQEPVRLARSAPRYADFGEILGRFVEIKREAVDGSGARV